MKIGFIGCGNMGSALAKSCAKREKDLYFADHIQEKAHLLSESLGGKAVSNLELCSVCDIVFLGVKPNMIAPLLQEVKEALTKREKKALIVSMAAGVAIDKLLQNLPADSSVIRIMPNIPAAVGEGMILYATENVASSQEEAFLSAMSEAGKVLKMEEKFIDAGCALSGSGPAFVALFIEALADGGVLCGLSRADALLLAEQTALGMAKYLRETGIHPAAAKDAVSSPAGTTIAGVKALEENGFRGAVIDAVYAAFRRSKELG